VAFCGGVIVDQGVDDAGAFADLVAFYLGFHAGQATAILDDEVGCDGAGASARVSHRGQEIQAKVQRTGERQRETVARAAQADPEGAARRRSATTSKTEEDRGDRFSVEDQGSEVDRELYRLGAPAQKPPNTR
jgi:hypothetical protein